MKKESILKAIVFNIGGSAATKVFMFLSSIMVARALGPELLGKYMIIISFGATMVIPLSLGTNEAFVRYFGELSGAGQRKWVGRLIKDVMKVRILWYLCLSALIILFSRYLFDLFGLSFELPTLFYILGYIFFAATVSSFETYLQTQFKQKFTNSVETLFSTLHFFILGFLFFTNSLEVRSVLFLIFVLLVVKLFLYGVKSIQVARLHQNMDIDPIRDEDYYRDLKKRFFTYSFYMFIIALGGIILAYRSDVYFLSYFLGLTSVGYYNLVNNFVTSSYSFFMPRSIGVMFSSTMVQSYQEAKDISVLNKYFQKQVEFIFLFTFPLAVGGSILAEQLITVFYGIEYLPAVPLFISFFLITAITKFGGAISSVFVTIEKPQYFLWTKILSIINIPLNVYLIPRYGTMGALYATTATLGLILIVEYFIAKRISNISLPWKFIRNILFSVSVMGGGVKCIVILLGPNIISQLIYGVLAGASIYIGCIYFGGFIDKEYSDFLLKWLPFARKKD